MNENYERCNIFSTKKSSLFEKSAIDLSRSIQKINEISAHIAIHIHQYSHDGSTFFLVVSLKFNTEHKHLINNHSPL